MYIELNGISISKYDIEKYLNHFGFLVMKWTLSNEMNAWNEGNEGSVLRNCPVFFISGYVTYGLGLAIEYFSEKIRSTPIIRVKDK